MRRKSLCALTIGCSSQASPPTLTHPQSPSQARKLEGELDIKIAAYGKLCSSYEYGYTKGESGLSTDHLLHTKAAEIDASLARLSDVNASMGHALSGNSDSRTHTLARHRDILHDFSQEYRRLSAVIGAARERADLLGGSGGPGGGTDAPLLNSGNNAGLLLRERGTLDRTNTAADQVINQAQGVAAALSGQRQLFDTIDSKVASIGAKFPVVNTLLNAIRRKKNRDNVIVASVLALCVFLMLIYWVNK